MNIPSLPRSVNVSVVTNLAVGLLSYSLELVEQAIDNWVVSPLILLSYASKVSFCFNSEPYEGYAGWV